MAIFVRFFGLFLTHNSAASKFVQSIIFGATVLRILGIRVHFLRDQFKQKIFQVVNAYISQRVFLNDDFLFLNLNFRPIHENKFVEKHIKHEGMRRKIE